MSLVCSQLGGGGSLVRSLAVFSLAVFGLALPVHADDVRSLRAESDVVALGTIVGTETFPAGPGGRSGIHTRVDLAVDVMLLGAPISVVSFWVQGATYGNRRRVLEGQATFAQRRRAAVLSTPTRRAPSARIVFDAVPTCRWPSTVVGVSNFDSQSAVFRHQRRLWIRA